MANDFLLSKLYAASATSPAAARRQGSSYSLANVGGSGAAAARRKRLLEQAVATGKIKPESLGPVDSSLLGIPIKPPSVGSHSPGILGGIGHFIGHFGTDVFNAGKYLPQSVANIATSLYQDRMDPFAGQGGHESHLRTNVVDPILAGYKETYGHGTGHFLHSFYEHPLGPILDAASVVSLGGSAAARAGGLAVRTAEPDSALARLGAKGVGITSREGRSPFVHPSSGVSTPREFTPRPVAKLGQAGLDLFTRTGPDENLLGRTLRRLDQNSRTRRLDQLVKAQQWDVAGHEMQQLESIAKLTPDEAMALTLAQKGINTPEKIMAFQKMVHDTSLADPEELKGLQLSTGISEKYIRHMGTLPDSVKEKIINPNDRMQEAHQVWKSYVQRQQQELGITDEVSANHLKTEREKLDPYLDGPSNPPDSYPIEHTYVPSEEAAGFIQRSDEGRLSNFMVNRMGRPDTFRRGPTDRSQERVTRGARYDQQMFQPKKPSYAYASSGDTFAAGAFRTDARMYLDHVAKRARDNADELWKKSEFDRISAKDPANGEVLKFKNQGEVDSYFAKQGVPKGRMIFVNDQMPQIYFRKEVDYMEQVRSIMDNYLKDTPGESHVNPLNDPHIEALVERMTEADANAFIKAHFGSMKRQGGAIPSDEFNYRMRMMKIEEPFTNPVVRFLTRWMHRWRTAILTLMPRWGLNTALGSMVLNTIRGVSPRDYWIAQRLHGAGFLPENLAREGHTMALPTGANLGHQATQEMLESAAPGYGVGKVANFMGDLGIKFPVRAMAQGVQNIENYFRRAQFVHNLRREQRLGRDQQGRWIDVGDDGGDAALGNIGDGLNQFYKDVLGDRWGQRIGGAINDPKYVDRALRETDKMMYNYSVLGPTERRIVRQFVPFWGWYKFISMAAYRMTVDMPGRMNLVNMLSQIAAEQEKEMGPLPDWLRGSLPLGLDKAGQFTYMSTMGMNPLSQVLNPAGPQGPVGGLLGIGQTSPLIQSGLSAFGMDPLSGGQVSISPESGVGSDFSGNLFKNGHEVQPIQVGALQRLGMGMLRSFPEYRIAEREIAGPQFPESVPFFPGGARPMAPSASAGGPSDIMLQMFGVAPKSYNLGAYQAAYPKRVKYAETQRLAAIRRLKAKRNGR